LKKSISIARPVVLAETTASSSLLVHSIRATVATSAAQTTDRATGILRWVAGRSCAP